MKLLENKECLAISWDRSGIVCGIKARKNKENHLVISDYAETATATSGFAAKLSEVYNRLAPTEKQLVVLGGYISGSVCFEIRMPKMAINDLTDAIRYELPRYLPFEAEDLYFGFRVIPSANLPEENNCRVRVFAVIRRHWDELLDDITEAGIKADFLLHPFLVFDPLLADQERIYLEAVHSDYQLVWDAEEKTRSIVCGGLNEQEKKEAREALLAQLPFSLEEGGGTVFPQPLPNYLVCCLLLGYYATGNDIQKDQLSLLALPARLVPERFRNLRVAFVILSVIVLGLMLGYLGRIWSEDRERFISIKKEIARVDRKIDELKRRSRKEDDLRELMDIVSRADLGNNEVLHCLYKLTQIMPRGIWTTSFQARGNYIDLTLWSPPNLPGDTDFIARAASIFKIVDSINRRNPDGSHNLTLRLEYLPLAKVGRVVE